MNVLLAIECSAEFNVLSFILGVVAEWFLSSPDENSESSKDISPCFSIPEKIPPRVSFTPLHNPFSLLEICLGESSGYDFSDFLIFS